MEIKTVKKGDSFLCIETFAMTGMGVLFTKDLCYASEHEGCLTSDTGCKKTIVSSSYFDFKKYFI